MTPTELHKARQDAGLTQQALADRLGVSIKTVQSWEGGWRTMPKPMQQLLALSLAASTCGTAPTSCFPDQP